MQAAIKPLFVPDLPEGFFLPAGSSFPDGCLSPAGHSVPADSALSAGHGTAGLHADDA